MKDILTYLTESANGGRALEAKLKSSNQKDFLIQVSNASKLNSKFAQNIKTIAKHVSGLNTVVFYLDEKFEVEDIRDAGNQIVGELEENNNKCILLLCIENDDKQLMNALMPVIINHHIGGKKYKDVIIGVASTKNIIDNLSHPVLARLGSPIMM